MHHRLDCMSMQRRPRDERLSMPQMAYPATRICSDPLPSSSRAARGPADYAAWELDRGEPVSRQLGREPERVDLVYCHRPFGELPGIVAVARRLGARAFWWQTGLTSGGGKDPSGCWVPPEQSRQARELAAAAGLGYIDDAYIADAARARGTLA